MSKTVEELTKDVLELFLKEEVDPRTALIVLREVENHAILGLLLGKLDNNSGV